VSYCVIGRHGFIGSALACRLGKVTSYPTNDTKVVFHFGSYTHEIFEAHSDRFIRQTLADFTELLPWCYQHGALFVYPSSALVYEKDTTFTNFKLLLERLVDCYSTKTLGLRLFPVYGPGEQRTVISQWCRQMKAGESPVVYGHGQQIRDFTFIDDAVDQILSLVEEPCWVSRIVDIGTGHGTAFNDVVAMINAELGTSIVPRYVRCPRPYSEGIICRNPLPAKTTVAEGIRKILAS